MRTIGRLAAAVTLAVGCFLIPLDAAFACSCAFLGHRDAIARADVAFVGTVIAEQEPAALGGGDGMPTATYRFAVERSKTPMASEFEMAATFGGDANCGFDMSVGEQWLVIASEWEGRVETNSCQGTARLDDLDPDILLVLEEALHASVSDAAPADDAFEMRIPTPVMVAAGALVLLGAVSVFAFRGGPRA